MARHRHPENETNQAQRRIALTRVYLKMACPDTDENTRAKLAGSILSLIEGDDHRLPPKKITDAQIVEMVWRQSQCVLNRTGKCPLLIFNRQLAEEINEFFAGDE